MADAAPYRWMRPLGLAAVAVVDAAAFQTHPAPGLHGQHLVVATAVAGLTAGTVGMLRVRSSSPRVQVPLLLLI
ncbi:MAG TPA: hypothetical protein VFA84_10155, partial [Acidimicrobiales bacterium]|nr:hypothetical protein [Acidimicrobiales bacterium]